jgi:lipopolysaccharide transport system ATP-binding protein
MDASILARDLRLQVPNFVQRDGVHRTLVREVLAEAFTRSRREFRTILDGLDFQFREGDRVALLGRNGAGKTTLLRVLSGAFQPTHGVLQMQGSKQALLNLGLGFNPQATVRENILLRATAMGQRLSEAAALMDSILDFADLHDVSHHRLLTLSSGQRMRLGFAISTSVQHDIMLMDEWFGAGDAYFVDKARARLSDRVDGCKILVLASHNFEMIRKVCSMGMVLEEGRQAFLGPVEDAIKAYKSIYQALPGYVPKRRKTPRGGKSREQRVAAAGEAR